YQEWKKARPVTPTDEGSADIPESAEEIATAGTLEEAEEAAWADISAHLRAMSPYEFQDLVAALLEAMGYHVAWIAPPGPDRGIDIMAGLDPLGSMIHGSRSRSSIAPTRGPRRISSGHSWR